MKMPYPRLPPQLLSFFVAFLVALFVVGLGVGILGIGKIDAAKPGVAPIFILAGLPFIWVVTLDVMDRIVATRHLAAMLEGFNEEDVEYMVGALTDRATSFMVSHKRFEAKWHRLIEFLNVDHFGRIASQALFQRSHKGRIRYFKQVTRIAQLRFRRKPNGS
jgi:hypothetical protein